MGRKGQRMRAFAANVMQECKIGKYNFDNFIKTFLSLKEIKQHAATRNYRHAISLFDIMVKSIKKMKMKHRYSGFRKACIAFMLKCGISERALAEVLQTTRKTVAAARDADVNDEIMSKSHRTRKSKGRSMENFIRKWVLRNTTPSSNSKNVVKVKAKGITYDHVKHYRTETIGEMHLACKLAARRKFRKSFGKTFFHKHIPPFVKLRKKQDGLCPLHHTGIFFDSHDNHKIISPIPGISLYNEFARKRAMWHKFCTCRCAYCSRAGCNHGKQPDGGDCNKFTCNRCKEVQCTREWNKSFTCWARPTQVKRQGGGLYWHDQQYRGTRKNLMLSARAEMEFFVEHENHVKQHKQQISLLMEHLPRNSIIIKADFIQNIVHSRGVETSQSYYGKRQTQLLVFTVWYRVGTELKKIYVDYLSSYLSHNSMFFQKSAFHLLSYLIEDVGISFKKLYFETDGGRGHFKSRISFFFGSRLKDHFGFIPQWIYDPPYHGKGECDSHGAVVKRKARRFVLKVGAHIDDEHEAAAFINQYIANATAFVIDIQPDDLEQDCTPLPGSDKFFHLRFSGKTGEVWARKYVCFCAACLADRFDECENIETVGTFEHYTLIPLQMRLPKARYFDTEKSLPDEYEVSAVLARRTYAGQEQYLVSWVNFSETTWVAADRLTCIDLLEAFENA